MQHLITIHWMGFRKDSGRGSIWGYFTEKSKPTEKVWDYGDMPGTKAGYIYPACYMFRGKIGKSLTIEETTMSDAFLESVGSISKNYRQCDPKKITAKWGSALDEELGMFLTMCKLRG